MILGFTGTRHGVNELQLAHLRNAFEWLSFIGIDEFHHGDCVGADATAHTIAVKHGLHIHVHPPERDEYRALCTANYAYPVKPYLERNRDIVDAADFMIACPNEKTERTRGSGTWYTIRYARETGVPVKVIYP